MRVRVRPADLLRAAILAAPIVLLLILAWRRAVPVPFGDDFSALLTLRPILLGEGSAMEGLWAPHMESRFVTVRAAMLLLGVLTGWNFSLMTLAVPLLAALNAFLLLRVLRPALDRLSAPERDAFRFLVVATSVSPVAWESWSTSYFLTTHLAFTFFLAAALLLREAPPRIGMPLAAAACALCSLSFIHGFSSWVLLLPLLPRRRLAAAWLLAGAALFLAYAWGMQDRLAAGPVAAFMQETPARAVAYAFALLGMPAETVDVRLGAAAGAAVVLGLFVAGLLASRGGAGRALLPAFCAYAFGLVSALAVVAGRLAQPLSLYGPLSSRYLVMTLPAVLCCIALVAALGGRRTARIMAACLIAAHLAAVPSALRQWDLVAARKEAGLACLSTPDFSDSCLRSLVWWEPEWVRAAVPVLVEIGIPVEGGDPGESSR